MSKTPHHRLPHHHVAIGELQLVFKKNNHSRCTQAKRVSLPAIALHGCLATMKAIPNPCLFFFLCACFQSKRALGGNSLALPSSSPCSYKVSQPYFEKSVRVRLTLPKWELGSPPGLSKLQSSIAGVKTSRIGVFFISLESYQIVDVENGLT
jgi:hypothetical protein